MKRLIITLLLCVPTWAYAADVHPTPGADKHPHPVISQNGWWAGVMIILILGMFLAALGVGIAIRLNPPEEPPPEPAHDDDAHGAHGHGHHAHGHGH
jgi:hypothetical protein